jgi:hypothetical protein
MQFVISTVKGRVKPDTHIRQTQGDQEEGGGGGMVYKGENAISECSRLYMIY